MQVEKLKVYPGGLVAVDVLKIGIVPPIINKIVEYKLTPGKFVSEKERQQAQKIFNLLESTPRTLEEYVNRLQNYNYISWADAEIESRRNISKPCLIEHHIEHHIKHHKNKSPNIYRVKVNKTFCRKSDIKPGVWVILLPDALHKKSLHVKVVQTDLVNQYIFVDFQKVWIDPSCIYKMLVLPNTFNFHSRDRVLTSICAGKLENIIFPKLPNDMLPLNKYGQQEARDLAQMNFSPDIQLNPLQKMAIVRIVRASPKLPYLLFGPPGTGKTTTLVEAVVQLLSANSTNKILVCTPSNTAADLFALALLKTPAVAKDCIFRMFSVSKPVEEQNPDLKEIVHVTTDNAGLPSFGFEPKEKMQKKYRVIVSTLSTSSYLVSGGLKGVFSHIFVDEAGQADELDTLIPIVGLADSHTSVVLAGDPKQLGPVETVEFLKDYKLSTSLLERFIKLACYDQDRRVMTMLRNNYRSHALLVDTPSKLFYNGRLIPSAVQSQKSTLCQWGGLPAKGVPIIFHSISGTTDWEKDGFSCCNVEEADQVENYVKRILSETSVKPKEIGVISPYKYQVKILRNKFSKLPEMVIDSVERFQGSERRVIIISTVRNRGLGFLDCDKRLNTAMTRAQELMIIVGNHINLSQNQSWKKVIEFCRSKKVLIGDLGSAAKIVQKKVRKRKVDKLKWMPVAVGDQHMGVGNSDDIANALADDLRNFSIEPRGEDDDSRTKQCLHEKSQISTGSKTKNFPPKSKGKKGMEEGLDMMTLNGRNIQENENDVDDSSLSAVGLLANDSVTSCCASDSFKRQFEEIMNSLEKL